MVIMVLGIRGDNLPCIGLYLVFALVAGNEETSLSFNLWQVNATNDPFIDTIFHQYSTDNAKRILKLGDVDHFLSDLQIHTNEYLYPDEGVLKRGERSNNADMVNITSGQKCYSKTELLDLFKTRLDNGLSKDVFLKICPTLLVQLDKEICPGDLAIEQAIPGSDDFIEEIYSIPAIVWGYGIGSIIAISISGLIAVGFIPCLQRVFLNTILQFLVSLAIGALTGDALLHLLPHALGSEVSPAVTVKLKHEEHQGLYKGLCGLAGIYLFYLISRLQAIIAKMKDQRMKKRERKENERINYRDYAITISDEEETIVALNTIDQIPEDAHKPHSEGEYHDHGHDHSVPKSAKALALRVIIGDGIHNFSDGMAIGVAFASSLTSGFSTSVAVFCHELPHEMGDFAVLLKKGMTVKQAIFYNCLSSMLSLIGMLIGLALGNVGEMSQWLFLGIAGMFLYISLVDLLPEMNMIETETKDKHPLWNLLYQYAGIGLGVGIMTLIALYETDLKRIIET